jgi:5S rRNA maturation endonuclease (ribonuclease M5)
MPDIRKTNLRQIKWSNGENKKYADPQVVILVDGTSMIIRDPDEIAKNFRDNIIKHFSQASECMISREEYQDIMSSQQLNNIDISQDLELSQRRNVYGLYWIKPREILESIHPLVFAWSLQIQRKYIF